MTKTRCNLWRHAGNILWPSWWFLPEVEHHDKCSGTRMLNHTKGSIYQIATVALWGRAGSKGIKTFNSPRARLRHFEAINSVPHHPKHQNVFSQKEHWTFISKHRLKLHIYKNRVLREKKEGKRRRSRKREDNETMENGGKKKREGKKKDLSEIWPWLCPTTVISPPPQE